VHGEIFPAAACTAAKQAESERRGDPPPAKECRLTLRRDEGAGRRCGHRAQSLIIALAVLTHNLSTLRMETAPALQDAQLFSAYLMLPFAAVTLALLTFNWCGRTLALHLSPASPSWDPFSLPFRWRTLACTGR
jgi:hypothetical protein